MLLTVSCLQPGRQGPSHSLPGWNRLLPRCLSLPCHSPGAHGQDRWWAATRGGKPPFQVSSLWKELFLKSMLSHFHGNHVLSWVSPHRCCSGVWFQYPFKNVTGGVHRYVCVLIFTQKHTLTHIHVCTRTQSPPSPSASGLLQSRSTVAPETSHAASFPFAQFLPC